MWIHSVPQMYFNQLHFSRRIPLVYLLQRELSAGVKNPIPPCCMLLIQPSPQMEELTQGQEALCVTETRCIFRGETCHAPNWPWTSHTNSESSDESSLLMTAETFYFRKYRDILLSDIDSVVFPLGSFSHKATRIPDLFRNNIRGFWLLAFAP